MHHLDRARRALAVAALTAAPAGAYTYVIYVDPDATSYQHGNPRHPYNSLQDALDVVVKKRFDKRFQIRIAGGVLRPDPETPATDIAFFIRGADHVESLEISGGWSGQSDPSRPWLEWFRDLDAFETVLSADLNGDDQPG